MTEPSLDQLFAMVTRQQTDARYHFENAKVGDVTACEKAINSLFETQAQLTMIMVKIERRTRLQFS